MSEEMKETDPKEHNQQWFNEKLYYFVAGNMEGSALTIVRNLKNNIKAHCVRAWYRIMREAKGQEDTKLQELTEKVFGQGQKAVAAE